MAVGEQPARVCGRGGNGQLTRRRIESRRVRCLQQRLRPGDQPFAFIGDLRGEIEFPRPLIEPGKDNLNPC